MADMLKQLGFEVQLGLDLTRKAMRRKVRKFGKRLETAKVGLFYYAGHGVQVKGHNYLIPLNVDIMNEDEVIDEGVDADSILRKLETAGSDINIIILDACRNNPFVRKWAP